MNEDQFREQIINDLEKKGITCINLHGGIFDLYIPNFKRHIICKKITSFIGKPNMTKPSGIEFTPDATVELRKLKDNKEMPIVVVKDDMTNKGSYYLLSSEQFRQETIARLRFKKYMAISILHYDKPILSYDDLLNELTKEIKK